jgi:NTP pyrophosphatase (non-canonical NTP hydrolase)
MSVMRRGILELKELVKKTHELSVKKGFWDTKAEDHIFPAKLMLIVSELAECMEADRTGDLDGVREELADVFIRLCDLCGAMNLDIEAEVIKKGLKNESRPYRHNKRY